MYKCLVLVGFSLMIASQVAAKTIRIMPLGDSITEGEYHKDGVDHQDDGGYRYPLQVNLFKLNSDIVFVGSLTNGPREMRQKKHEGHPGWKIEDLSADIEEWLKNSNPDIVLLMIGTNNMWEEKNRIEAPKKFAHLVDQIFAFQPHVKIFAASIVCGYHSNINAAVTKYNGHIEKIISKYKKQGKNVEWVEMNKYSGITRDDLIDQVHPGPAGYLKMAALWYSYVAPAVIVAR